MVGVSHKQVEAFLDWKEKQLKAKFAKKYPHLTFEVALPTMREREFVLESAFQFLEKEDNHYSYNYSFLCDVSIRGEDSYIPTDYITKRKWNFKQIRKTLRGTAFTPCNYILDGGLHTLPFTINNNKRLKNVIKQHRLANGISFMSNNVSEWTDVSYNAWKGLYRKRRKMKLNSGYKQDSLSVAIEDYYEQNNEVNGRMIVGGNWLDERHSLQLGENFDGAYDKRFVHPDSAHCTVGFRYVIRVKLKADTLKYPIVKAQPSPLFLSIVEFPEQWKVVNDTLDSLRNRGITIKIVSEKNRDNSFKEILANCTDGWEYMDIGETDRKYWVEQLSYGHRVNTNEYLFKQLDNETVLLYRKTPNTELKTYKQDPPYGGLVQPKKKQ